jgi:nanoRNase/pAp phosphatase (c-di-AMP/oligoRNAs hydrolase)
MRLYDANPNDQTFWERIFKNPTDLEVSRGKLLKQFEDQNNAAYCKACAFETTFEGLRAIAINKGLSGSLTFKSVYDKDKHDIMIAFFWRNGKWTISLYTENKDIDVSEICRKYKGGGHVGAAGCQVDVLPFPLK